MRWRHTWITTVVLIGLGCAVDGLRGSELVLAAKAKAAEEKNNPTTEEISVVANEDGTNTTIVKTKPLLTGNPRIDYIHDPNLPRELKGHNLTNYPFYNAVPANISFECDGLHDGFYASVPHHCQLYHHCLFGTRYDFLCANYTAFDQKTFICHFVSEVDCDNSPKYYIRNEALYKAATSAPPPSTTTTKPTTTTTTTEQPQKKSGRRRRPYRRRRPMYEYYYDDYEYEDDYYDEDAPPRKSNPNRRQQRPMGGGRKEEPTTTTTTTTTTAPSPQDGPLTRAPLSVYAPKVLPKIKRPVPINEKSKYDYTTKAGMNVPSPTANPKRRGKEDDEYYYDDEEPADEEYYDDEIEEEVVPVKRKESAGRRRPQYQPKRPSRYDDIDDEEAEVERPRRRKGNQKEEDYRPRNRKNKKGYREEEEEEEEPIAPERPGYANRGRNGGNSRKRPTEPPRRRRPQYSQYDDEEIEDEAEEEPPRRPSSKSKPRSKPTPRPTTTTKPTTTSKPTTTPKPTTKPTTRPRPPTTPEDEDDYIEYEDEQEIVSSEAPTTAAPHRFSTTGYRNTLKPVTESTPKIRPVTYRPRKVEMRRPLEIQSQVGIPMGFRRGQPQSQEREEEDEVDLEEPERRREDERHQKKEVTEAPQRQSAPPNVESSFRRRPSVYSSGEDYRRSKVETTTTAKPETKRPFKQDYRRGPSGPSQEIPRKVVKPEQDEFAPGLETATQPATSFRRPSFTSEAAVYKRPFKDFTAAPTAPEAPNYRRPYSVPPTAADVTARRPIKQENYAPTGAGTIRRRPQNPSRQPEQATESSFRSSYQSPRPVVEESLDQLPYFKAPQHVDFTAPGPSSSGVEPTQRPLPSYDIADEIDVTINDALQPSTLNPTVQYTRVKSRGYQSAVTHPYRGGNTGGFLIPSASQNYFSKASPTDQGYEIDAVLLPAARFSQTRYKPRRPADWYW